MMKETAKETMHRLYGDPVDVDKVWEDREALHEAEHGMRPRHVVCVRSRGSSLADVIRDHF